MNPGPIKWRVAVVSILVVTFCFCASTIAQRGASKYKKGDRVEVQEGFDWKPATVISVDRFSGWVDVRLDDINLPEGVPAQFRGQLAQRSFPPSSVRASRDPKARQAAKDTPLRTWTDRTGKFSIEARYQSMNGDRVVLLKSDGKRIEVPSEKLSEQDARYLLGLKNATESPFQEIDDAPPDASPISSMPSRKANWNGAKLIQPQTFKQWSFKPPEPKGKISAPAGAADVNVTLSEIPESQIFFEDVEGIYASSDGDRVVVSRNKGEASQDKATSLEVVDIAKQRAGGLIPLPETTAALDVDADANLVMYRPAVFGSGNNTVLTIARFESGKLAAVQQWEPYAKEDFAPSRDIEQAWFLSDNRVMTINGHGKALTIWDVGSCKALINIPVGISFNLQTSLSPDRQLLAIVMKEGIAVIDVAAGRHVGTVPGSGRTFRQVAIRGDNTRLAALSDQGITVWDLTNGKEMSEFYSAQMGGQASLKWAGEYLLADSRYLFDVERRILLWEYQDSPGVGVTAKLQNGRLYAVSKPRGDGGDVVLISTAVPHAAAIEMAKSLPPAEELLVVKPGDVVAIEVDIDPSVSLADALQNSLAANVGSAGGAEKRDSKIVVLKPGSAQDDLVRQSLASALDAAGLKVVDHSDLVVKAVCKRQPQQVVRINVDRRIPVRPQDIVEKTITPHASYLEMSLGGEVLWKRGYVAQPHVMIFLQQGETLDAALERLTKPNATLFTTARFSPYVARPGKATENGSYGVSQFTARGLVDGQSGPGKGAAFE